MSYNKLIDSALGFKKTLNEASKDTKNCEYMTKSSINVIDFDTYKDYYIKELSLPDIYDEENEIQTRNIKSNDALFINNDEIYFIEFKNGAIRSKSDRFNIHTKLYDSLLIILDILNKNMSFAKKNIKYILVFNEDKNPKANSCEATPFQYMISRLTELSNDEIIQFDLHKFKDIYLNEVHTYTKSQFDRNFVKRFENVDMFNQLALEGAK